MNKIKYHKSDPPKVSCVMVTADRKELVKRSIECYRKQTYPNTELIIIDDGEEDLQDVLQVIPSSQLKYVKLPSKPDNTLGKLRNRSLKEATGKFIAQWDDDDWYHPERIEKQVNILLKGYDACCLSGTLMHLNVEPYKDQPYIGYLPDGVPGSIIHRANFDIRYPHTKRAEDTVYLEKWMEKRYLQLPDKYSYLCIRCYHGSNTWGKNHFLRRIRNNPKDAILYLWYKKIKGDLFSHPKFSLPPQAKKAFQHYVNDSRQMELL